MGKPYENYEVIKDQRHIVLRCKICHEDTELWPDYIVTERFNYNRGHRSCACAGKYIYSAYQQEVLVKRALKGTRYTFVKFENPNPNSYTKIVLNCNICSLDTEMFMEGDIVSTRHYLGRRCPCACGHKYVWSERQNILRVERKCKDLDLIFLGWGSDYKGLNTKVKLKHSETGFEYTVSTISKFLGWVTNDAVKFAGFPTGITSKGGIIKVIGFSGEKSGNNNKVLVECSICNKDTELFPNPFESTLWQIRSGKYPCMCNNGYKNWTNHEYEVRIRRRLQGLSVTWDGILPENANAHTKLNFTCHHHQNTPWSTTKIDALLNSIPKDKYGCSRCPEKSLGFYESRSEEDDTLYVVMFDNDYIKIGRSFDLDRRLEQLNGLSGTRDTQVINTFSGKHKLIYDCEQACHKHLKSLGYYHHESTWTIESFHKESYDHAVTFITNYLKSYQ